MPFAKGYKPISGVRVSQKKETSIRLKDGGIRKVTLSRSSAIKAFCTECCGWGEFHPKDCSDNLCPLYLFRGKINLAYGAHEEDPEEDEEE